LASSYQNLKTNLSNASFKDFLFPIFLSLVVTFFLIINFDTPKEMISNSLISLTVFFVPLGIVLSLWFLFLSDRKQQSSITLAHLSLTPILILLLLIPYSFFNTQLKGLETLSCVIIVCIGGLILNKILTNSLPKIMTASVSLSILLILYLVYFSFISVFRHLNYQNTSPFDVALYSQIQWNNIHGHFFQSSISGSNFVTHNSPFLALLSPFYALYPHPETLLVLKTLFLTLSAVPFYLISKHFVHEKALLPLTMGYMFFPFTVGQNINAPHETCFLPPLLLFSYYFFLKGRFKSFLIFLLLSLSIKEHLAFISIMYGLYALYLKKEKRWIITPILLGICWAVFSIWIINHFQKIYHTDPLPAWLVENIKNRFLRAHHASFSNFLWGLKTSNLGHWFNLSFIYFLISPLAIFFPFISPVFLLGLPELIIDLLADLPLTYPTWHYSMAISCFLLVGCVQTIKKLSIHPALRKLNLSAEKIQEFLAWFLCICILSHFFLWWEYTNLEKRPRYVQIMNTAIELVPKKSTVSLSKHLVAYVSDRKDYFICEDDRKGEYIVLDQDEQINNCLKDPRQVQFYTQIYSNEGIKVYKKTL